MKASIRGKENPGFNSKTHFTPFLVAKPSIIYSHQDSARASNDEDYGFAAAYADCGLDSIEESTVEDIIVSPPDTTTSKCFSEGKGLDQRGVCYPSNSLESRLLKSIVRDSFSSNDEETGEESEEEHCTQLDVLLKLCSEEADDDRSNRSDDFSAVRVGDIPVHCPLCGSDISCLTDELRQVHTNDCLDKEEAPDVILLLQFKISLFCFA